MTTDHVPYVRTIVLPKREPTALEIEAIRNAMNANWSAIYAGAMLSSGSTFTFPTYPATSHCSCEGQYNRLLRRLLG